MAGIYSVRPPLPTTPFSFSILVDSPIRCNLPFSPVSAMLFPLAKTDVYLGGIIIAGLNILMTFLFKRSLAHPPAPTRQASELYPLTLTLPELNRLMQAAAAGLIPLPSSPVNGTSTGQGQGPVGGDEPLFPDNLSVALIVTSPFAPFDGSPDTSFNVPLFEIPGVPGNLIIALSLLFAQFLIERAGIKSPGCQPHISEHTRTEGFYG